MYAMYVLNLFNRTIWRLTTGESRDPD